MAPCNASPWLKTVDCFFCLFIFMPLAVFHWRGTWDLLDVYIVPDSELISSWITLVIGVNVCFLGQMVQPHLSNYLENSSKCVYVVVSRVHMYLFAWGILCYWRGLWNLVDLYFSEGWINSTICYICAMLLSVLCLTSRTNAGLPLQAQVDYDPDLMRPDTRFFAKEAENVHIFALDICFTQLVVVSLNILVWRGMWNILDYFLFPEDHFKSDMASLIIGYSIMFVFFTLQYPMSLLSARMDNGHKALKIAYEDVIIALATWGVLNVWRAEWDFLKEYFVPDPLIGGWVCHVIGTVGLMLLQGFANVGTNGIDIDGSYQNGEAIFPTDFLRPLVMNETKCAKKKNKLYSQMSSEELEEILMMSDDDVSIDSEEELIWGRDKMRHKNGGANGALNGALAIHQMEDSNL